MPFTDDEVAAVFAHAEAGWPGRNASKGEASEPPMSCRHCGTRKDKDNGASYCPALAQSSSTKIWRHEWEEAVTIDRSPMPHWKDKDRLVDHFAATPPSDAAERKASPVYSGFVKYFPLAMFAVAQLSRSSNEKHNPGQPLHWSKDKSNDHADCMARHLAELDAYDGEADHDYHYLHAVKMAWRAMANLQTVLETGKPARKKKV
jgi:hypothetical protein